LVQDLCSSKVGIANCNPTVKAAVAAAAIARSSKTLVV
jgi:NCAIR mutase (PurE)-related protein